jgi:hypothetical protein
MLVKKLNLKKKLTKKVFLYKVAFNVMKKQLGLTISEGATTLSITTLSTMTLSITTFSIMGLL